MKAMIKAGGLVTDKEWPVLLFGIAAREGDWQIEKVYGYCLNAVTHKLSEWWREELDKIGLLPEDEITRKVMKELAKDDGGIALVISDSEIRNLFFFFGSQEVGEFKSLRACQLFPLF